MFRLGVICSFFLYSSLIYAGESGFYLGGSLGYSHLDEEVRGPVIFSSSPITTAPSYITFTTLFPPGPVFSPTITSTTDLDDEDIGWKLYGGYIFNKYFNLEVGYVDLGDAELNEELTVSSTLPAPIGTILTSIGSHAIAEVTGFTFTAVIKYPLLEKLSVFGKVGAFFWQTDTTVSTSIDSQPPIFSSGFSDALSFEDNGSDVMFGFGAEYDITERWGVRAEWERYSNVSDDDNDIDYISGGVIFRFN